MKLFTLPDGTTVRQFEQFQIGNQRYPGGWLATAPKSDIQALGITVANVADPIPDPPQPLDLAQRALDQTDLVAIRCFKAGVAFPPEWLDYTNALRTIVRTNTGAIPTRPPFPTGT